MPFSTIDTPHTASLISGLAGIRYGIVGVNGTNWWRGGNWWRTIPPAVPFASDWVRDF